MSTHIVPHQHISRLPFMAIEIFGPENLYRHKWQAGDVLMWDNVGAHHMAITDYKLPQRRYLIRTSVSGTPVF